MDYKQIIDNKELDKITYHLDDIEIEYTYSILHGLQYACLTGNIEVVKHLVELGADIHSDDNSVLRYSVYNNHLEVVKYLVEQGADIHAGNNISLRVSAYKGYLEIVKYLVEQGANKTELNNEIKQQLTEDYINHILKLYYMYKSNNKLFDINLINLVYDYLDYKIINILELLKSI
jgi:ankyrin repeat protein